MIAFNVLSCVDDFGAAIAEAWRILRSGGCLAASIPHPLYTAGRGNGDAWRIGDYLAERPHDDRVPSAGIVFSNVHRPLEAYVLALERTGLLLEAVREPREADGFRPAVSLFLHFRAVKP